MNRIFVFELAGKNAISMQNGDKLYKLIHPHLLAGDSIAIDFNGVSLFASPFFNASIALLLKDIPLEKLQKQISFENLNDVGRDLLNHAIGNAISFYNNSETVSKAIDQSRPGKIDE